ncbi:hypothetical protein, partial [uncultured Acinetobacter sp.]|uniref:hypothetical protein n=1 Tax=uncultured Acinetobacter sp. TaxID=165433 RepID=UPI00261280E6
NEAGNATYTNSAISLAKYFRISGTNDVNEIMMNKGENLLQYEDFGIFLKPSYIQKSESNNEGNEENTVTRPLFEQAYEPSFPTLNFVEIEQTWRRPYWMSEDGAVIYGAYGAQLIQSKDEWTTKVQVGTVSLPQTILAIRTLADGELLIYCSRNEAQSIKGKLYKTVGYDRNDPSVATFKEVFEILSTQADINNTWGLSVYQNVVVANEYGLRGANGAKHVYLSTDYGETFNLIFNLYTQEVAGRPLLTDSAHTHTAAYDPYYNRIWVAVGDRPNTASYFSDDLGQTWTFIQGSEEVQYTGIQALPDCVIFGSDRAPNGVYVYYRNGKDKHPIIQPLFIINDSEELTNVFGLPFKKDWHPTTPTYFVADKTEGTNYKPQIIATVDGRKAHFMYEHPTSVRMWAALGPTAQGNIITVIQPESSPNGLVILKATAPNWIKV